MLPARRGVGWLVASCPTPPLVVPFVHSGMDAVMPRGAAVPRPGGEVRVLVGAPVPVADLLAAARTEGWTERALHDAVTRRVGTALHALKAELDGVAVEEVAPAPTAAASAARSDALLPLIEDEMVVSMQGRWRSRWEGLGRHRAVLERPRVHDVVASLAEYSAARMQHMQWLVAGCGDGAAAGRLATAG